MNYYNYPFNPVFTNQPTFTNGGQFYFVNNKQEAENWIVNPDSTVYLFDKTNKQFFIKSVEKSGQVKPLEVYSYEQTEVIEKPSEYATKQDIESLREEIKEIRNEHNADGITDTAESQSTTTDVVSEGEDKPRTV